VKWVGDGRGCLAPACSVLQPCERPTTWNALASTASGDGLIWCCDDQRGNNSVMVRWATVRQDYLMACSEGLGEARREDLQLLCQAPGARCRGCGRANVLKRRLGGVVLVQQQALEKAYSKERSVSVKCEHEPFECFGDQLRLASMQHSASAPEQRG
jgi:hypothetical protein